MSNKYDARWTQDFVLLGMRFKLGIPVPCHRCPSQSTLTWFRSESLGLNRFQHGDNHEAILEVTDEVLRYFPYRELPIFVTEFVYWLARVHEYE